MDVSCRYPSIPGRIVAGGGLSAPQAAGGGSEAGNKTPEERKQPAQGFSLYRRVYFYSTLWLTETKMKVVFQAEKMRAQLASLPPLCPARLPQVSKDSSTSSGGPNTGIYRRTDQLLATLLKLSADVKVVDVTGKTAGTFHSF